MTIWFTADTHFGSQRTLELSRRPFKNVREMDAEIMRHWAENFEPGDTLFHLGDFGVFDEAMSFLRQRGVTCHLVLGNYEEDMLEQGELTYERLYELGFATAAHQFSSLDLDLKMIHRPQDCDKSGDAFNLFGHIHGRQLVKRYGLDVGIDGHHFRPLSLEDVMWWRNAIENHYDENVFS